MSWKDAAHVSRDRLLELFGADASLLHTIVTASDDAYRAIATQIRFASHIGSTSTKGYYKRKPVHPAAVVLARIYGEMSLEEQFKFRNTISYLRSEYKRSQRDGETVEQKRARYQRAYYARRKREKKLELVRVVLPRQLYKDVVEVLDAAHRPDLTEQLIACKVQK